MLEFDPDKSMYDPSRDIVRFHAKDGVKQISCAVSREALMDYARVQQATDEELVEIYRKADYAVQNAAQFRYQNGAVEADGLVLVRTADLNA